MNVGNSCSRTGVGNNSVQRGGVVDACIAERIIGHVDDVLTLAALDRVNKLFHSFAAIKLKMIHARRFAGVAWVTSPRGELDQLVPKYRDCAQHGIKVSVMGDIGSGKTCIVEALAGHPFVEHYVHTVGARVSIATVNVQGARVKLELWDLSGDKGLGVWPITTYRGAIIMLLVYDVTNPNPFDPLSSFISGFRHKIPWVPKLVLCGTKADLLQLGNTNTTWYKQGLKFAKEHNFEGFIQVSAKTMMNIPELLTALGLKFAKEHNFEGFIQVSAKTMMNIPELLTALGVLALEDAIRGICCATNSPLSQPTPLHKKDHCLLM
ncbi:Rab8 family GTPase [Pelomyxa schiedti]|nr:Rab8 family GTPase [Pelomyxa schiedti]